MSLWEYVQDPINSKTRVNIYIFLWAEGCSHLVVLGKSKRFIVNIKFTWNEIHILLSLNNVTQILLFSSANSLFNSGPISGNWRNVMRNYLYNYYYWYLRIFNVSCRKDKWRHISLWRNEIKVRTQRRPKSKIRYSLFFKSNRVESIKFDLKPSQSYQYSNGELEDSCCFLQQSRAGKVWILCKNLWTDPNTFITKMNV